MKVTDSENEREDSEELEDFDICDETTIKQTFNQKCETITSKVIDKDKYILHLHGSS